MKMLQSCLITYALCLILFGCATLVDDRSDNILLMTNDGSRVKVRVNSKSGPQTLFIPGIVTISKSCRDTIISVIEDDNVQQSTTVMSSGANPWIMGNIVFGGIPGLIIDAATGAMCTYDKNVLVPIARK